MRRRIIIVFMSSSLNNCLFIGFEETFPVKLFVTYNLVKYLFVNKDVTFFSSYLILPVFRNSRISISWQYSYLYNRIQLETLVIS